MEENLKPIPFNKPYLTGKEELNIKQVFQNNHLSGNGEFTKKCQNFFETKFGIKKALMTTSCTDALEMAAILIDIKPGDEVIMPSYTFVSTANAFILRGAKIVFVDSKKNVPGMDEEQIENLITKKTKAIVPVHYAGVACNMEKIMSLAQDYNLYVIEDAAQAFDSYYIFENGEKKALGSIGHLSAFSFHETKNIISGEGGLLGINDKRFFDRAEVIWEKGTNRSAFFRGEINKYGWVDIGSSFLPSEIISAFLFAQLLEYENIQAKRLLIWNNYRELLSGFNEEFSFPEIPSFATNNAHMFYIVANSPEYRSKILKKFKTNNIKAVFHYLSLHKSDFYNKNHDGRKLENADKYSNRLIRLPFYYELSNADQNRITDILK